MCYVYLREIVSIDHRVADVFEGDQIEQEHVDQVYRLLKIDYTYLNSKDVKKIEQYFCIVKAELSEWYSIFDYVSGREKLFMTVVEKIRLFI